MEGKKFMLGVFLGVILGLCLGGIVVVLFEDALSISKGELESVVLLSGITGGIVAGIIVSRKGA